MTTIEVKEFKRVDLIRIGGRIDVANVGELEETLQTRLDADRYRLVVNLAGINFMNSAGIRALVAARSECRKRGGDVRIAEPTDRILGILEIAGLIPLFEIYDDDTTAVGSF
jgi:anti-anti-sigma factor